jgi:hypothetical protein
VEEVEKTKEIMATPMNAIESLTRQEKEELQRRKTEWEFALRQSNQAEQVYWQCVKKDPRLMC